MTNGALNMLHGIRWSCMIDGAMLLCFDAALDIISYQVVYDAVISCNMSEYNTTWCYMSCAFRREQTNEKDNTHKITSDTPGPGTVLVVYGQSPY